MGVCNAHLHVCDVIVYSCRVEVPMHSQKSRNMCRVKVCRNSKLLLISLWNVVVGKTGRRHGVLPHMNMYCCIVTCTILIYLLLPLSLPPPLSLPVPLPAPTQINLAQDSLLLEVYDENRVVRISISCVLRPRPASYYHLLCRRG